MKTTLNDFKINIVSIRLKYYSKYKSRDNNKNKLEFLFKKCIHHYIYSFSSKRMPWDTEIGIRYRQNPEIHKYKRLKKNQYLPIGFKRIQYFQNLPF